ncbi:DUF58 domain-containing protein [Methylosarcina fibrata]|uniref:DUF58 domain-containing protein n=1 Tax=Methylosarcina fibrata TaxID=105972 RepID=UPI00037553F2|nr:DUF58 domain-containing protein [Methylosarcina fibrata]
MLFKSSPDQIGRSDTGGELTRIRLKTLIDLSIPAAGLTLQPQSIRAGLNGSYVSGFKGRGMEFDETRLYQAGDDIRSIDWRVTARTGKAHTKIFREERERPVFISVDNRRAMHFATRGVFKSVMAAKLAGLLAWASEQHGDRIGGQIFSDASCRELKPRSGKHGVLRFLHALVNTAEEVASRELTLDRILSRLVQHARPGSLVYIVSDFRGVDDAAEIHLAKLAQHCEIELIFIYDALERSLPEKGLYRFTDEVNEVVVDTGDNLSLASYRQRFDRRLQRIQSIANKMNLNFMLCSTSDDPVQRLRRPSASSRRKRLQSQQEQQ